MDYITDLNLKIHVRDLKSRRADLRRILRRKRFVLEYGEYMSLKAQIADLTESINLYTQ